MKIIDENGVEITNPDLNAGYLKHDTICVHHEAINGVEEQWHYEVIAEFPNGGKEVKKIVDAPGVEAQEAWDEYEPVLRYVLYTEEELAEQRRAKVPTAPRNITVGEYVTVNGVLYKATSNIPNGEPIIVGQNAVVTTVEEQLYELAKGE